MIFFRLRAVALAGATTLVALGLVACSSDSGNGSQTSGSAFGSGFGAGAGSATPRPTSPSPTPSPTPTGVSPGVYQQALTDLDAALAPAFLGMGAASTPTDLSNAASAIASTVETERQTLDDLRPPQAAATAHDDLNSALATLASDLRTVARDADSQALCDGSSGLQHATGGTGAHQLRLAAAAVAAADPANPYTVGSFLPAGTGEQNRRPANGNIGSGGRYGGYGELTVTTSLDTDAVVKLTEGDTVVRTVFVQAGSSATVDGLPDGSFTAFYTTGTDWDDGNARFTRNCAFSKFDDPLPYTTSYLSTSVEYTTFELTLYEIVGGNASTSDVDPGAFPAG